MKQPPALKILFLTEMWERFGFYTMQAMLVFYMIEKFSFSDADAYTILGQFTALVYLGPVIGGWVSDRFLGNRFSVMLGGFSQCIGYALLALTPHALFIGMASVIIGNSLLKPNISSFLGQFYHEHDPRREAGFTLFYIGINLGVLLATSSAGYIQVGVGWMACFGAASFALILSVAVFRWGFRYFDGKGLSPLENKKIQTLCGFLKQRPVVFLWLCLALTILYYSMTFVAVSSYGLYLFGMGFFLYVIKITLKLDKLARQRMLVLLLLFALTVVFWALYFQVFFVVNVFTDRVVDRSLWHHNIPTSVFIGLESVFVMLVGTILANIWQRGKIQISIPMKFVIGIFLLGFSMQILAWVIDENAVAVLPALWIVLFYSVMATGELFVSPIGLSMVTEFSPKEHSSLMMGGWCMTMGFGGKLTGILSIYASIPEGVKDLHSLNSIYSHAFQRYALIGFVSAGVCLLFVPFIKKWLHAGK